MENTTQLAPLMEVNGVEVVFALDQSGKLIATHGSSIFTPDVLQRASTRIVTLMGALSEYLRPAQDATLVYEHHLIILRRRDDLTLAVLAQNTVNQVALKLAGNLCLKRLAEPVAKPTPMPPLAPATSKPAVTAARPAGVFQAPARPQASPGPKSNTPPKRGGGIWG
jgi:hypothetical protein